MITKGNWEYAADLGEVFVRNEDGTFHQLAIVVDNDADGELMASAPEMLEMLRCMVKFLAYTEAWKVVKLIEKAEGK